MKPYSPGQERALKIFVRAMSWLNVVVFRLSGGRVGSRFRGGAPVLLLTTIGRRSGTPRTTPLLYLAEGEKLLVVASQGGMSRHPSWFRNLEAQPEVDVQIGSEHRKLRARRASDEEKAGYWPRLVAMYSDFDDYQARAPRDIPVVILTPL